MRNRHYQVSVTAVLVLAATSAISDYPVAGVHPDARPAGVPVIQQVQKNGNWYGTALTGISQPYPGSLRFLEDQGAWYTPFNHPGMPGRYDIRGWHAQDAEKQQ